MTRVMMAVDGSDLDEAVVDTARRLFGPDADYWAVNVQGYDSVSGTASPSAMFPTAYGMAYPVMLPSAYEIRPGPEGGPTPGQAAVQRARSIAASAAARAADVEAVGEVGNPAVVIRRTALEHDVDVVVLGVHHRGWFSKLLDPSVTDDLIEESPAPLLLVSNSS